MRKAWPSHPVIPAKAGTQVFLQRRGWGSMSLETKKAWIPACAGTSGIEVCA
jgi:hypothetical protein